MSVVEHGPFLRVEEDDFGPEKVVHVFGNRLEVVIVANNDGSLYIEVGAQERGEQAVVSDAFIDRYRTPCPHLRVHAASARR